MDPATSISSCSRNPARAPDVSGMEQVLSDLQALQGLYGLLHPGQQATENLDEASRALLMRMLDNATQQTLLKQAKLLSGPLMSPALERKLSIQPGRRPGADAEQRLKPIASPSLSRHGSVRSRRINMESPVKSRDDRHVYDDKRRRETDDHLLARVASNRSSRTAIPPRHPRTPEQRLSRVASNRSSRTAIPPRHPRTPEQRLARLSSHCSSRTAVPPRLPSTPEQRLARLSSHRSSRTAVPPRLSSTPEQRLARLSSHRSSRTAMPPRVARLGSHRSSRAAEPWRDVASGSASRASRSDRHSRLRRGSGSGDRSSSSSSSSPEGSSSSSRGRSVSPGPALSTARFHGRATAQGLGAGSSSAHRRIGRQDSRLSMGGVTSRRGSPRRSSSSSDGKAVTIRSRIRPNRELLDRCVRRAEELEELSLRRRGKKDGTVRSGVSMARSSHLPRRALDRIDSVSTYSSGSSSPPPSPSIRSPSTVPTASSTLSASASPCSSSSVSASPAPRASARPEYAFEAASNTSRNRRRRERQERRLGRLQRFKDKLALVFHHRHDHHHHHHIGQGGRSGSPLPKPDHRLGKSKTNKSPWSYLGGMFHHGTAGDDGGKKKEKKSTSKTVVTAKPRGGGGHTQSLFGALVKHKLGGRKAPVPTARGGMGRVPVKKMNWWQQLRQRRGRAEGKGKPRLRLGRGKAP